MWTISVLSELLLTACIFADKLCPDEKVSCPEDKACCLVGVQYECCITELPLALQENDISANYSNPIGAAVQNSGWCRTNSDCMRFQTCCPAGVCCPTGFQCCGDHCCPSISRCCSNKRDCCLHNMACCDEGCCDKGSACCKGECCPFMSKCCSSGCSPLGYTCCGDSMCTMASKCCSSDLGSWCCSRNKNCGRTYQTCGATGVWFSPVIMLLAAVVVKLKGFV